MKIVLCGPPRSGKSCLREGLKQAILAQGGSFYPYVITANPDGEGCWFQDAVLADREEALRLKAAYKAARRGGHQDGFTDEFVACVTDWVSHCHEPLVLVDIGGKTTPANEQISRGATHAVLLAAALEALLEWRDFCARAGLTILAEIRSDREGEDAPPVQGDDGIWCGSVAGLARGRPAGGRPTVQALARIISQSVAEEQEHSGGPTMNTEKTDAKTATFHITVETGAYAPILRIGFGVSAHNDRIVRDAKARVEALIADGTLSGGPLLKVNGPASLPVAFVLAHAVGHLYSAIAVYDPKLPSDPGSYVVVISHSPDHQPGDRVP